MASAILVGAIVFAQIGSFRSLLGAMRGLESRRLNPDSADWPAGGPTWRDVYSAWDKVIQTHPDLRRHLAVQGLLRSVVQVQREGPDSSPDEDLIRRQDVAVDGDNLLARLAYAVLADMRSPASQPGGPSAAARYAAMRDVVSGRGAWRWSTLYNAGFTRAFTTVMQRYFTRPDVAVALARVYPHNRLDEHYSALPIIQRRVLALAGQLRGEGDEAAADACVGWMGDCLLGLIESEPDGGTRLLCAELLAGCVDPESDAAGDLRRLKADYHAHADAAPMDRVGGSGQPAVDPAAYRAAFRSLLAVCALALIAVGAGLACLMACAGAMMVPARGRGRGPESTDVEPRRSRPARVGVALAPSVVAVALVLAAFPDRGLPSQSWAVAIVGAMLAFGLLGSVATAVLRAPGGHSTIGRGIGSVLASVIPMIVFVVPPVTVTRLCGTIDTTIGTALLFGTALFLIGVAAMLISPASFRALGAAAALVCLVGSTSAFVCGQYHHALDKRYQSSVVEGRRDEMSARLGADWPDRYLGKARAALGVDLP